MDLEESPRIQVVVRKRPLSQKEIQKNEQDIVFFDGQQTIIIKEPKIKYDLTKYLEEHIYNFDMVFGQNINNQQLYKDTMQPLIKQAFNNAKVSCFAYGQTGSGKTYTMMGDIQNGQCVPGLFLLGANDIFQLITTLYDLLNEKNLLHAREDAKQNIQIVGLQEKRVDNVGQLMNLISFGMNERAQGQTSHNEESSRSHAILQIVLRDQNMNQQGKISFIDLAGSERAQDVQDQNKQTRIDGAEINKSLLALKECIRALDSSKSHVPFRGSKLTLVLKDSFIGNCHTIMIGNISPGIGCSEHTLNTLRYADRVKEMKRGDKANEDKGDLIDQLFLSRQTKNVLNGKSIGQNRPKGGPKQQMGNSNTNSINSINSFNSINAISDNGINNVNTFNNVNNQNHWGPVAGPVQMQKQTQSCNANINGINTNTSNTPNQRMSVNVNSNQAYNKMHSGYNYNQSEEQVQVNTVQSHQFEGYPGGGAKSRVEQPNGVSAIQPIPIFRHSVQPQAIQSQSMTNISQNQLQNGQIHQQQYVQQQQYQGAIPLATNSNLLNTKTNQPIQQQQLPLQSQQLSAMQIQQFSKEDLQSISHKHEQLIQVILQEEEEIIALHRQHIDDTVTFTKNEMSLLHDVDKPGSDVEQYVNNLSKLLEQKATMISTLQTELNKFKENLSTEEILSSLFYQQKKMEEHANQQQQFHINNQPQQNMQQQQKQNVPMQMDTYINNNGNAIKQQFMQ